MGTQQAAFRTTDTGSPRGRRSHDNRVGLCSRSRLAIWRDDITSLKREGLVALSRWYQYRKAVRQLSQCEDRTLHEFGIERAEIPVTAYSIAEQAVSARPDPTR